MRVKTSREFSDPVIHAPRLLRQHKAIVTAAPEIEMNNGAIDPRFKIFLVAVRAGLLQVCKAIERYLDERP